VLEAQESNFKQARKPLDTNLSGKLEKTECVLLERICTAYNLALENGAADGVYGPTSWWRRVGTKYLEPARDALRSGDIVRLHSMYSRFYRNTCSSGLIRQPPMYGSDGFMELCEASCKAMREDMLYRIGYWRTETGGRYPISALGAPEVGMPLGISVDSVFVAVGAEYQHACADRIRRLAGNGGTVAELGGGFGNMAYFLLGMNSSFTYVGFDVPESLALCAYYLGQSRPERKLFLYGEQERWRDLVSDIVLMPTSEMQNLPNASVDVTFSSHLLADLDPASLEAYAREIARFSRRYIVNVTIEDSPEQRKRQLRTLAKQLKLIETRLWNWNIHRAPKAQEWEDVYKAVRS